MTKKKGIVIICNLDTRGEDIVFVKHLIEARGAQCLFPRFQHGGATSFRWRYYV